MLLEMGSAAALAGATTPVPYEDNRMTAPIPMVGPIGVRIERILCE